MSHTCPGCQAVQVGAGKLSCPPCWFRLPRNIRTLVNDAWRARQRSNPGGHRAHREAVLLAVTWYGNHPRKDRL